MEQPQQSISFFSSAPGAGNLFAFLDAAQPPVHEQPQLVPAEAAPQQAPPSQERAQDVDDLFRELRSKKASFNHTDAEDRRNHAWCACDLLLSEVQDESETETIPVPLKQRGAEFGNMYEMDKTEAEYHWGSAERLIKGKFSRPKPSACLISKVKQHALSHTHEKEVQGRRRRCWKWLAGEDGLVQSMRLLHPQRDASRQWCPAREQGPGYRWARLKSYICVHWVLSHLRHRMNTETDDFTPTRVDSAATSGSNSNGGHGQGHGQGQFHTANTANVDGDRRFSSSNHSQSQLRQLSIATCQTDDTCEPHPVVPDGALDTPANHPVVHPDGMPGVLGTGVHDDHPHAPRDLQVTEDSPARSFFASLGQQTAGPSGFSNPGAASPSPALPSDSDDELLDLMKARENIEEAWGDVMGSVWTECQEIVDLAKEAQRRRRSSGVVGEAGLAGLGGTSRVHGFEVNEIIKEWLSILSDVFDGVSAVRTEDNVEDKPSICLDCRSPSIDQLHYPSDTAVDDTSDPHKPLLQLCELCSGNLHDSSGSRGAGPAVPLCVVLLSSRNEGHVSLQLHTYDICTTCRSFWNVASGLGEVVAREHEAVFQSVWSAPTNTLDEDDEEFDERRNKCAAQLKSTWQAEVEPCDMSRQCPLDTVLLALDVIGNAHASMWSVIDCVRRLEELSSTHRASSTSLDGGLKAKLKDPLKLSDVVIEKCLVNLAKFLVSWETVVLALSKRGLQYLATYQCRLLHTSILTLRPILSRWRSECKAMVKTCSSGRVDLTLVKAHTNTLLKPMLKLIEPFVQPGAVAPYLEHFKERARAETDIYYQPAAESVANSSSHGSLAYLAKVYKRLPHGSSSGRGPRDREFLGLRFVKRVQLICKGSTDTISTLASAQGEVHVLGMMHWACKLHPRRRRNTVRLRRVALAKQRHGSSPDYASGLQKLEDLLRIDKFEDSKVEGDEFVYIELPTVRNGDARALLYSARPIKPPVKSSSVPGAPSAGDGVPEQPLAGSLQDVEASAQGIMSRLRLSRDQQEADAAETVSKVWDFVRLLLGLQRGVQGGSWTEVNDLNLNESLLRLLKLVKNRCQHLTPTDQQLQQALKKPDSPRTESSTGWQFPHCVSCKKPKPGPEPETPMGNTGQTRMTKEAGYTVHTNGICNRLHPECVAGYFEVSLQLCLSWRWTLECMALMVDAMCCVHSKGVAHNDTWLRNFMFQSCRELLVIDYGNSCVQGLHWSPDRCSTRSDQRNEHQDMRSLGICFVQLCLVDPVKETEDARDVRGRLPLSSQDLRPPVFDIDQAPSSSLQELHTQWQRKWSALRHLIEDHMLSTAPAACLTAPEVRAYLQTHVLDALLDGGELAALT